MNATCTHCDSDYNDAPGDHQATCDRPDIVSGWLIVVADELRRLAALAPSPERDALITTWRRDPSTIAWAAAASAAADEATASAAASAAAIVAARAAAVALAYYEAALSDLADAHARARGFSRY